MKSENKVIFLIISGLFISLTSLIELYYASGIKFFYCSVTFLFGFIVMFSSYFVSTDRMVNK